MNQKANYFERNFGAIILLVVLALCSLWLGTSVWLISEGSRCEGASGGGLLPTFLSCMSPNEIGDTLAGIFAPLAFILLGAAVVIQSRELRAQQHEMAESREVFIEQRDLMAQQILEAKRSADLFGAQNEILKAQEAARLRALQVDTLNQMLSQLALAIRAKLYQTKPLVRVDTGERHDFIQGVAGDLAGDELTAIAVAANTALRVDEVRTTNSFPGELEALQVSVEYGNRQVFAAIIKLADRISRLGEELGDVEADLIAELRVDDFARLMRTYLDRGFEGQLERIASE